MAEANFDDSLKRILVHEGGYTNHPKDPGGPTNFGITIHDYRKYINPKGTALDVKTMRLADAKKIYRARYWDNQRCSEQPGGVDYSIFDYGINSGVGRSGKVLRRVVGLPSNTSVINDEVLRAVAKRNPETVVKAINAERIAFLKSLKTWPTFGAGWGRRVKEVLAHSLFLCNLSAKPVMATPPIYDEEAAKGIVPDPKASKAAVKAGIPASTAASGATWWDWVVANPFTSGVIAVSSLILVAALIYWLNERRRKKQETPMPVDVVPEAA